MTLADIQAKLDQIFGLLSEKKDLKAKISGLKDEIAARDKTIAELTAKITEQVAVISGNEAKLTAEVAALKGTIAERDKTIAEFPEKLKAAESDAGKQAADIVAATGIPIAALPKINDAAATSNRDEVIAQFSKITDPKARGEFYLKHKKTILQSR